MDSNSRRLTRSTYIGEPSSSQNRKTRSSSTDSENGWIPPPPLLPLGTKFLITNPQPLSHLSHSLLPSNFPDPISTGIAIAHLKCQPSNPSHPEAHSAATPSFRVLEDHELIQQPSSIPPSGSHSNQQDDTSDFIQAENKAFSRRHRQSEMIEKRSKKLEKEKLLHERFKLKNRLDILVKGSGADWKSVRTLTLKRIKEDELKERSLGNHQLQSENQRRETEFEKVERMRHIMIQETEEILKRYDKLLDTRKPPKKWIAGQPIEARHLNQASTPSSSQMKPAKHQSTPSSARRRLGNQVSSDHDHPLKSRRRTNNETIPKLNIIESLKLECDVPLNPPKKRLHTQKTNGLLTPSNTNPAIPAKLPDSQTETAKSVKIDECEHPTSSKSIPTPSRESLYDSVSIRRLAMDEHLLNGKKRVGRSTYALGCRLPDLKEIRLDYLAELQSMVRDKRTSSCSTPFDRPERRSSLNRKAVSATMDETAERDDPRELGEWIEFNPTVNEEREIISHQGEFALQSKFFELDSELEYLEEQKMIEFYQNILNNRNEQEILAKLNAGNGVHGHQRDFVGGKSIRKLIEERIQSWET